MESYILRNVTGISQATNASDISKSRRKVYKGAHEIKRKVGKGAQYCRSKADE